MSKQDEIRVQVNGPRPPFGEVAKYLWGTDVDFHSDGDSASPDDPDWTELTIERRDGPAERVDDRARLSLRGSHYPCSGLWGQVSAALESWR